jgi:hypothetical protein
MRWANETAHFCQHSIFRRTSVRFVGTLHFVRTYSLHLHVSHGKTGLVKEETTPVFAAAKYNFVVDTVSKTERTGMLATLAVGTDVGFVFRRELRKTRARIMKETSAGSFAD